MCIVYVDLCLYYIFICVYICLHIYMYYICMYIHIHVYIYIHIYMCVCYICVCIYIYMYVYIYVWWSYNGHDLDDLGNIWEYCHDMSWLWNPPNIIKYCHIFDVKTNWKIVAPWVARCKAKGPVTFPFSMNQLMALGRALVQ
jgi:hypothetical protein